MKIHLGHMLEPLSSPAPGIYCMTKLPLAALQLVIIVLCSLFIVTWVILRRC